MLNRPEAGSTPWQVLCTDHGPVALTKEEYVTQMLDADSLWKCPICGSSALWDDENYEKNEPPPPGVKDELSFTDDGGNLWLITFEVQRDPDGSEMWGVWEHMTDDPIGDEIVKSFNSPEAAYAWIAEQIAAPEAYLRSRGVLEEEDDLTDEPEQRHDAF